jgi:hypothetical protein
MAITIDYITRIIDIPKVDLILIQSTPFNIYELDIDNFRLKLKNLEDDVRGMPHVDTHRHNTAVTVGGVTLARVIEIINGYTITFEDGAYAVNLVGANSNIGDVLNLNQVSVRSNNSAGLASSSATEYASFNGGVWLNVNSSTIGTAYPSGTEEYPVNNLADAIIIAESRGFTTINFSSDFTFIATDNISNYNLIGRGLQITTLTFTSGCIVAYCQMKDCKGTGALTGIIGFDNCYLKDLGFVGLAPSSEEVVIRNCLISGVSTMPSNYSGTIKMLDCWSDVPGSNTPIIDWGGSTANMFMRNYAGGIQLNNITEAIDMSIDLISGQVILDSTCTAGDITIRGVGKLTDNSIGSNVFSDDLLNRNQVSTAVWDEPIGDHLVSGTTGLSIGVTQFAGVVAISTGGESGTTFPIGTENHPVDNLADAITIAEANGIEILHFNSDFTFGATDSISNYVLEGHTQNIVLTLTPGCILGYCKAQYCTITGVGFGLTQFENCVLDGYESNGLIPSSQDVLMIDSLLKGTVILPANYSGKIQVINCNSLGTSGTGDKSILDMGGADCTVIFRSYSGSMTILNNTQDNLFTIDVESGRVELDSSCTAGTFKIRGVGLFTDNSTGTTINTDGLMSKLTVSTAVWDEPIGDHLLPESTGHEMYHQSYQNIVHIDTVNGSSGTAFPIGTTHEPCDNLADALTIARAHFFDIIHIIGALTIDGEDITGITIGADRSLGNSVTITSMINTDACYFTDLTVSGALSGATRFTRCVMGALTGFNGGAKNCLLTGTIEFAGTGVNYMTECDTYVTSSSYVSLYQNAVSLNIIRGRGRYGIFDKTSTNVTAMDLVSGFIYVDSSCDAGEIHVGGIGSVEDNSSSGCTVRQGSINKTYMADAVWDELTADHTTAATAGKALIDAGAAGNPWDAPVAGSTAAGTFGELVGRKLLTIAKFLGLK